jgi:hypothetical protein
MYHSFLYYLNFDDMREPLGFPRRTNVHFCACASEAYDKFVD